MPLISVKPSEHGAGTESASQKKASWNAEIPNQKMNNLGLQVLNFYRESLLLCKGVLHEEGEASCEEVHIVG